MSAFLIDTLTAFDLAILIYFLAVNTIYLAFTLIAFSACARIAGAGRHVRLTA